MPESEIAGEEPEEAAGYFPGGRRGGASLVPLLPSFPPISTLVRFSPARRLPPRHPRPRRDVTVVQYV